DSRCAAPAARLRGTLQFYAAAVNSDVDRLADECTLLIHSRVLARWVGQGRQVTPKGVMRPADVASAAEALAVSVPAKVRTAADIEAIHRPWVAAQALGLLRVGANQAVAVEPSGGEDLQQWWAAVTAVLRAESHDDRHCGASVLCRTILTALATGKARVAAELVDTERELLHDVGHREHVAIYEAFRRGVMPIDAALGLLREIGATDDDGRITALGRWLAERLAIEFPPPISPELPAADLLTRLATLPDDEVWEQAGPWLAERNPAEAADELLASAGKAPPAERVVAVAVVAGLGESAMPAWHGALDDPMVAPHARSVLADPDDEENADEPQPDDADQRWLSVEYALAALATDGAEEAYHLLRDLDAVTTVADSGHPDATALTEAVAALIAAGGPAVPGYQLKITLTRVRPPVWRRIRLPATTTLASLHRIIQVAFDWDDDHLHVFTADGRRYADPFFGLEECADESRARLSRLLSRPGESMSYVYDLGDSWTHQVTLERIIDTDNADEAPTCIGGQSDAPVEDWFPDCGREPTPFNVVEINRRLAPDRNGSSTQDNRH
ncbi:MAG TPA: plasmid pRiA4b ORF-3 family protein, partial [Actinoplanes sp.]